MADQIIEYQNVSEEFKSHLRKLLCTICVELVTITTVPSSGHTLCVQCIRKWTYCPTCWLRIITFTKCLALDNYLNVVGDLSFVGAAQKDKDTVMLEDTPVPLPATARRRLTGFPREPIPGRIEFNIDDVIDKR